MHSIVKRVIEGAQTESLCSRIDSDEPAMHLRDILRKDGVQVKIGNLLKDISILIEATFVA